MDGKVFSGVREKWLPLYEQLRGMVINVIAQFEEHETSSAILWKHSATFAEISAKKNAMVVAVPSDVLHEEWNADKTLQTSKNRVVHYFEVTNDTEFSEIVGRIQAAYQLTKTSRPTKREPNRTYSTVDEYIASCSPERRRILQEMREAIFRAVPEATEKISWQMPTYYLYENLVHFADAKNHISLFPSPEAIVAFSDQLVDYKTTKGGIQFPLSKPVDYVLIEEITRWRLKKVKRKYDKT